jgi:8-oxo-dGTP pyrophosphatase MutT (NUDIX family)
MPPPDSPEWARPDREAAPEVPESPPWETQEEPEVPAAEPLVAVDPNGAIRAAGGLVWTRWGNGPLRVLVVHRPKYDDWSLPKGKANPGESDSTCALREVEEETGVSCSLGEELGSSRYLDRKGRAKKVRYWAMEPLGGAFTPNQEIDEIRWLPADEAVRLLNYERDRELVSSFAAEHDAQQEEPPAS